MSDVPPQVLWRALDRKVGPAEAEDLAQEVLGGVGADKYAEDLTQPE